MRLHALTLVTLLLAGCDSGKDNTGPADDTSADTGPTDADGDGWTLAGGDCDDADPNVHPGATETWYDGVDQDCSGGSDYDADADGYDSDAYGDDDCNDSDSSIHPGATEVCNWIDDDCDDLVDADDPDGDIPEWHPDKDGDGHGDPASTVVACEGPEDWVEDGRDCDDSNWCAGPDVEDLRGAHADGVDDDCDGRVDEDLTVEDASATFAGTTGNGEELGMALTAGDLDGDGVGDLVVGAPYADAYDVEDAGAVYVYSAPLDGGPTPTATRYGEGKGHVAGDLIEVADVDGDGLDDLVTGVWLAGSVYVTYGPLAGGGSLHDADATIVATGNEYIATDVADAGDPDADGTAEFWVAGGVEDEGRVWLMDGPLDGIAGVEASAASVDLSDWGGSWTRVASGDLDGDGTSDLVIGVGAAAAQQRAAFFPGPLAGEEDVEDVTAVRALAEANVWLSVAAGDIDGDGYDDMSVASQSPYKSGGEVFVFHGPLSGEADMDTADARLLGASFYYALLSVGVADLDNDDVQELIVGTSVQTAVSDECEYMSQAGAVWVVSAPSGTEWLEDAADLRITGEPEAWAGSHAVADFDGNGTPDLAVGAPHMEQGGGPDGAVYLFSFEILGL